jgi:hypothetical protein
MILAPFPFPEHDKLRRYVARKLLSSELKTTDDCLGRFESEAFSAVESNYTNWATGTRGRGADTPFLRSYPQTAEIYLPLLIKTASVVLLLRAKAI